MWHATLKRDNTVACNRNCYTLVTNYLNMLAQEYSILIFKQGGIIT
jgi:hypothetical protein